MSEPRKRVQLPKEEDEIYIDCQPVNASGKLLMKEPTDTLQLVKSAENVNMKKLIRNPIFDIILGMISLFIIIAVFRRVWKYAFKPRT